MRSKPGFWSLVSLLCFAAAFGVWRYAEKVSASRAAHPGQTAPAAVSRPPAPSLTKVALAPQPKRKSYRVSNTRATEKQLRRSGHAIILRNALIDTDRPLKLDIPAHLRAKGAPGSYIVQSDAPLGSQFYDRLKKDGVTVVSYIPNNAALVQATPDQAREMASDAEFQAVIPYEPYYKLDSSLLPAAVANDQPQSEALNVTAFPGQRDAALAALQALGAQLMGEDTGPFGTTLSVMVPPGELVAVAQLPLAQEIESYSPRRTLNDLARPMMSISTNSLYVTPNYMGLTGSNVTVSLNDTGVDTKHPDFNGPNGTRLRGFPNVPDDLNGHGTHVGGSIAGNGSQSTNITTVVPGETTTGAGFQGKATNAYLFVQSIGLATGTTLNDAFIIGGSLVSDESLQTNASVQMGSTNLISNNSWGYEDSSVYDMHAASFDQATRDAQPNTKGEQPMLFVFAAGGQGNGNDYGEGGTAGSILSPATAKNVITVGALDEARYITNEVNLDDSTNELFYPWTDNDQYVAWFSGCGNVGVGIEGNYGRFKPDVVAPGVFTISCRATNYQDPTNSTQITTYPFPNQQVLPGQTNTYSLPIPPDLEEVAAVITPNANSPTPFPNLDILAGTTNTALAVYSTTNFVVLSSQLSTTASNWYFGVTTQPGQIQPVAYDFTLYVVATNDLGVAITNQGGYYNVIGNLNSQLKPWYVYQYGTSMAAAAVSGMLALMQEFLQSHPQLGVTNPSPALLKAMLINGSRITEQQYDYNPQTSLNEEGWGLPNLTNSLPLSLGTNSGASNNTSMLLIDQSTNNALATGESETFTINCSDANATNYPMRFSLVWTDPPGNPAAGIALVNNLDLLVTDSTLTNIWLGNDFFSGDIFTEGNTGDAPDVVNNVQNVYINPGSTFYKFPLSVTVLGMHVNVNAATTMTNLIAQDFALVIESDDTSLADPLTIITNGVTNAPPAGLAALINATNASGVSLLYSNTPGDSLYAIAQGDTTLVTPLVNGSNYLHERVGANEPNLYANGLLYTNTGASIVTNGNPLQWHFFVFPVTQFSNTDETNFMVTTFMPPDLATQISPRTNGADIDLYVSTNSGLTNLDPTVFAEMTTNDMSLSRGGDEAVIFTNAQITTYYIGVKSEDQQAADFGIYAVAQSNAFSTVNADGTVTGTAGPVVIPDTDEGPPAILHVYLEPTRLHPQLYLQKVTATLSVTADNPSDYLGTLEHNGTQAVLNSYSSFYGGDGFTNVYNDLDDNNPPGINSAGPGSLKSYVGTTGAGMWTLTETDNAVLQTGQVNYITLTAYPQPIGPAFDITLCGQQWFADYLDVPDDATNVTISVSYVSGDSPVGIFINNTDNVTATNTDDEIVEPINAPGGYLTYSITNKPPLTGGVWYFGIYNYDTSTNSCVTLLVQINYGLSQVPNLVQTFTNTPTTPIPLPVDATTNTTANSTTNSSQICVSSGQQIIDLSVGVRLTDPNLDDLTLQLTSPQGTSLILFENRGGLAASNLGLTITTTNTSTNNNVVSNNVSTNYIYTTFTEDPNLTDEPIKFAPPPYAYPLVVALSNIYTGSFDYFTNLELITTNTGGAVSSNAAGVYTNGQFVDGWLLETNLLVTNTALTNEVTGTGANHVTNQVPIQVTNQVFNEVSVVNDTNATFDGTNYVGTNAPGTNYVGSNYLALASGRLSQTFPTVPGDAYEFIYYARSPGMIDWWPADDNTIDLVGTNNATTTNVAFDVGEVKRAFTFNGQSSQAFFGTNTGNFATNDFSIDFWVKGPQLSSLQTLLEKRVMCDDSNSYMSLSLTGGLVSYQQSSGGNSNIASLLSTSNVTDGVYHYVTITRHGPLLSMYIDGTLNVTNYDTNIANISNTSNLVAGASAVCGDVQESTNAPPPTNLTVQATANIYGAGLTIPPDPGGPAPESPGYGGGTLPPTVPIPTNIQLVTITASGWITLSPNAQSYGADGGNGTWPSTGISSYGGISGITNDQASGFMVGVFLPSSGQPATAPPSLDFSTNGGLGASFAALAPALGQTFFIGDGLTGTASGNVQQFYVPAGAGYLYLGFADGQSVHGLPGAYNASSGSLAVSVSMWEIPPAAAVAVSGQANIFGAGLTVPPDPGGSSPSCPECTNGGGILPPSVALPPGIQYIYVSAAGLISTCAECESNGPDGSGPAEAATDISGVGGISGILGEGSGFLVGVFLGASQPATAPTNLNFNPPPVGYGTNFTTLSPAPALGETFYIGDGYTNTDIGILQKFLVPPGASNLYLGIADANTQGQPGTYDDNTGWFNASVIIPNNLAFEGDLDEIGLYDRALSPAEVHAIYAAGSQGKYNTNSFYPNFQLVFDGVSTNDVVIPNFAEPAWQLYTNSFVAASNQTTIEMLGNTMGVLFDEIGLVQLPYTNYNNYYLPEEPLAPLIGQNPQGCWTLSIWDSRSDSDLAANGALLSWTLQMTTSSTNVNLILLTNDVPYTNSATNGFVYFGVDVPQTANYATNILTNATGPMNLYFNQNALPTGSLPGDFELGSISSTTGGSGSWTLSTQGRPPALVPGQRYFLGVQPTGTAKESFTIQVNFDVGNDTNIIALTNGLPLTSNIGSNGPAFYSFKVPTNAVLLTFQLLNLTNGEANLYAREDLPVPSPTYFDYASLTEATNDQFIAITTNSQPVPLPVLNTNDVVPLQPTQWYLSVINPGTNAIGYTILATYVISNKMDVISLNPLPYYTAYETNPPTAPPGFPTNLMYSFTVTNTNIAAVQFVVTNYSTNGTLQLLVGDGVFPTPQDSYSGSFNPGTNNQLVSIVTNSSLLTLSNIWYLAVPNTWSNNAGYSISAIVVTNFPASAAPLFIGASISSPSKGFSMYWSAVPGENYQIEVSTNLSQWSTVTNITAQSTTASYTDSVPVESQKSRFFRIVAP